MPQFTPEQAQFLMTYGLADYSRERETTRRVLAAVPAGQEAYTPDPKSMTALKLAWHIASSEWFFMNGIAMGAYDPGQNPKTELATVADVISWYDEQIPPVVAKLQALSAADASKVIDFFGVFQAPACGYLMLMLKHSAHHRGQLSTYLRPMGAKVPGIYGPSGDQPVDSPK